MLAPSALFKGIVQKLLPSPFADDRDVDKPIRLGKYGELLVPWSAPTRHGLSEEGAYLAFSSATATNPLPGTALSYVIQTAFSDTVPFLYLFNNEAVGGKSLFLDFLDVIVSVAPATTTQAHYAIVTDAVARFPTTNNMIALNSASPNSGVSLPFQAPSLYAQNTSTASAVPASNTQNRRVVARGALGGLPVVGDSLRLQFGSLDGGAAAAATTAGNRVACAAPVVLAPQHSAVVHLWFVGNATTAMSYELQGGLWFR